LGAHSLKCDIQYLHHGKKDRRVGYLVELTDDTRQQSLIQLLNSYNNDLESKVEEKTQHIRQIQDKIILSMADMVESRDNNTGGHVKRTSECVRIFVDKLKQYPEQYPYSEVFFQNVVKAAPMHDLGKIAVEDRILRKPGRYTPKEFDEMKQHSAKGADIVRKVLENVEDEALLETAVNVAHYHHEKWNGTGYPEGLKGEEIPLEARIMALADVFDALVSKRCYKESYDFDRAFVIIEESLGSHFDANLGRIFLDCREELVAFYSKQLAEDEEDEDGVLAIS
jgi:response regulator RpfG family c-di-GMP phosphodiesterase